MRLAQVVEAFWVVMTPVGRRRVGDMGRTLGQSSRH